MLWISNWYRIPLGFRPLIIVQHYIRLTIEFIPSSKIQCRLKSTWPTSVSDPDGDIKQVWMFLSTGRQSYFHAIICDVQDGKLITWSLAHFIASQICMRRHELLNTKEFLKKSKPSQGFSISRDFRVYCNIERSSESLFSCRIDSHSTII